MAAKRFELWRTCEQLRYGELVHYITDPDRSTPVTYRTFARHCDLTLLRESDHPALYRMSCESNWAISFHKSTLPTGQPIYYFDWSRIEHIFVDPELGPYDEEAMMAAIREQKENPSSRPRVHSRGAQGALAVLVVLAGLRAGVGIARTLIADAREL